MTPVTDAMVHAANTAIGERRGMRGALEAAMAISPHIAALRSCPLPDHSKDSTTNYIRYLAWMYDSNPDVASLIMETQS